MWFFETGNWCVLPEKKARHLCPAATAICLPTPRSRQFRYSEFNLIAKAASCSPGSILTPMQVHVEVTQRLVIVDVHEDGSSSASVVEENKEAGSAGDTWIHAAVPTGDIIPGEGGTGNFLAVRRTKQLWKGTGPGVIEEFQYRINDDRTVKYRFPVPVSPFGFPSTMLLGENNFGYTTRGKIVVAFNTETGKEIWRWESTRSMVMAYAALKDDEVMVHEGGGYSILKDGQVVDHREEGYIPFCNGLATLGKVLKKDFGF